MDNRLFGSPPESVTLIRAALDARAGADRTVLDVAHVAARDGRPGLGREAALAVVEGDAVIGDAVGIAVAVHVQKVEVRGRRTLVVGHAERTQAGPELDVVRLRLAKPGEVPALLRIARCPECGLHADLRGLLPECADVRVRLAVQPKRRGRNGSGALRLEQIGQAGSGRRREQEGAVDTGQRVTEQVLAERFGTVVKSTEPAMKTTGERIRGNPEEVRVEVRVGPTDVDRYELAADDGQRAHGGLRFRDDAEEHLIVDGELCASVERRKWSPARKGLLVVKPVYALNERLGPRRSVEDDELHGAAAA